MRRKFIPTLAASAVIAALGACQTSAPVGNSGGRVDPYRQTTADRTSPEVSSVTLLEFADQVSQALSARLATVPDISNRPAKVALEMGSIKNDTSTPSSDFHLIRRKIFLGMVNNQLITQHADIFEQPERMDAQAERFGGGSKTDLFDDGHPTAATARYALSDTYLLEGTFGEIKRGPSQSTYLFDCTVTNLASRKIVFAEQFTSKELR